MVPHWYKQTAKHMQLKPKQPHTFCSLITDGWGVGSVSLRGMQRRRHGALAVLEIPPWTVLLAQGAGRELVMVPGLAATVALTVHEALALLARWRLPVGRTGPPWLLGVAVLFRPPRVEQPGHRQHALNGFFCAW